MKDQLIDRIYAEHEEWLAELKKKPADEIVRKAYEICYREEFISILECYNFDDEEIEKLMQLPNILDILYDEWLKTDASICQMLKDVVTDFLYEIEKEECDNEN